VSSCIAASRIASGLVTAFSGSIVAASISRKQSSARSVMFGQGPSSPRLRRYLRIASFT
jgi:hypothetical protein